VRLLVRYFHREIWVRGNCDQCPFGLAAQMRGSAEWMMDLTDEHLHEDARGLLEFCADATIQFIRLMAATGAHMVSNGDSAAGPGVISPSLYRAFAWPYEQRVAAAAHSTGLPYLLHICGKTDAILHDMVETGADALELDYKTDVALAREVLRGRATFVGNLDPSGVLARMNPREIERETRRLLEVFHDSPRFILNAGCAIPSGTPPENLRAMLQAARSHSFSG
jgi:uroporphyrinogen decarboxylase